MCPAAAREGRPSRQMAMPSSLRWRFAIKLWGRWASAWANGCSSSSRGAPRTPSRSRNLAAWSRSSAYRGVSLDRDRQAGQGGGQDLQGQGRRLHQEPIEVKTDEEKKTTTIQFELEQPANSIPAMQQMACRAWGFHDRTRPASAASGQGERERVFSQLVFPQPAADPLWLLGLSLACRFRMTRATPCRLR